MIVDPFPIYCPFCKGLVSRSVSHCPHCGTSQAPPVIVPPDPFWVTLHTRFGVYWPSVVLLLLAACLYGVRMSAGEKLDFLAETSRFKWFFSALAYTVWGSPVLVYLAAETWFLLRAQQSSRLRRLHLAVRALAWCLLFVAALLFAYGFWVLKISSQAFMFLGLSLSVIVVVGLIGAFRLAVGMFRDDITHAPEGLPFSTVGLLLVLLGILVFPAGFAGLICAAVGASKRSRVGWFVIITAAGVMIAGMVLGLAGWAYFINWAASLSSSTSRP